MGNMSAFLLQNGGIVERKRNNEILSINEMFYTSRLVNDCQILVSESVVVCTKTTTLPLAAPNTYLSIGEIDNVHHMS